MLVNFQYLCETFRNFSYFLTEFGCWCAKKEKDVSSIEKFLIVAVIGHRLEPWSQALSRFKRPLENQFSRGRNSL